MAENRVTAEMMEVGIARSTVPGNARVTAEVMEVAMLKNVAPGAFARLTAQMLEVAIVRPTDNTARAGDFFFSQ